MKPIDIPIGTTFGWLTALWPAKSEPSKRKYICVCDCGKGLAVFVQNLLRGNSKSCGCKKVGLIQDYLIRHDNARVGRVTKEYKAFQKAKSRCQNSRDVGYPNYGGRGIEFRFNTFEEFFAAVGKSPTPKHSIDRINNNGHYEAGNVRWATAKQQANNRRPRQARTK